MDRMLKAQGHPLYRLTYESRASLPKDPDARLGALQDILNSARLRNIRYGVSGALLYNQTQFFQILEGHKKDIEKIFRHIVCDARHVHVEILERKFVLSRIFHSWSMAFIEFPVNAAWSADIVEDLPAMLLHQMGHQARHEQEAQSRTKKQAVTFTIG